MQKLTLSTCLVCFFVFYTSAQTVRPVNNPATGNGFYIRLLRAGYNYVFFNLNNIREDRIKAGTLADIQIGKSSYEIIKEYSRITPLTYQLDMETGTLH